MAAVTATVLAVLALVGQALAAGDDPTLVDLFGGDRWRLESVTLRGETLTPGPEAVAEFVIAEDGRLAGSVGCNQMGTRALLTHDGEARFEPTTTTLMACPEPAMSLERAFTTALERVDRFLVAPGHITFSGEGVEVVFVAAAQRQDQGTP